MTTKLLPANVRGYIKELQGQITALSERAANLSGQLALVAEQNELCLARIATLEADQKAQTAWAAVEGID